MKKSKCSEGSCLTVSGSIRKDINGTIIHDRATGKKLSRSDKKSIPKASIFRQGQVPASKQKKICNRRSKFKQFKRGTKKYSKMGNLNVPRAGNRIKSMDRAENIDPNHNRSQESATPDAQSVLLNYLRQNPNNRKVLSFLKKHYDVEYDFDTKQWKQKDNEDNSEKKELPLESMSTALSSLVNKDFKSSIITQMNNKKSDKESPSARFGNFQDSSFHKAPESKQSRNRLFSDPRDFKSSKGIELEDYDTFFKKQCLPKNLRGVNLKVLELNSRTNASNVNANMVCEVPKTQKNVINMKYDLKRMITRLDNDKFDIKEMKKKAGMKHKKKLHNQKSFIPPAADQAPPLVGNSLEDMRDMNPEGNFSPDMTLKRHQNNYVNLKEEIPLTKALSSHTPVPLSKRRIDRVNSPVQCKNGNIVKGLRVLSSFRNTAITPTKGRPNKYTGRNQNSGDFYVHHQPKSRIMSSRIKEQGGRTMKKNKLIKNIAKMVFVKNQNMRSCSPPVNRNKTPLNFGAALKSI